VDRIDPLKPNRYRSIQALRSSFDPVVLRADPAEGVRANQNKPRGSPLFKQKFELGLEVRFDPNL
jgi:hypothetical protein